MRRASVEQIEKLYQSKADQARERRVSLTIMNCIWARNTERETTHPVHGEVVGKLLYYMFVFLYSNQGGRLCPSHYYQPSRIQKAIYTSEFISRVVWLILQVSGCKEILHF